MIRLRILFPSLIAVAVSLAAARDDLKTFPIDKALNTPEAREKLGRHVRFYFGKQSPGAVAKALGEFKTSKKTNAFNKTEEGACQWAFLSAMITLRNRAEKEGGNAVVNIRSNYKNNPFSSETEYQCGSGAMVAGVALIGEVVKLEAAPAQDTAAAEPKVK